MGDPTIARAGEASQQPCATCSSRAEHIAAVSGGQTANAPLVLLYIVLPACWEARQDASSQAMPAVSYRKI